ncbi:MAG: hypothetical protein HQK53_08510 [Oligoflexia bacterium]|nr:hypothetical protein [Oligoflexia bacterium]
MKLLLWVLIQLCFFHLMHSGNAVAAESINSNHDIKNEDIPDWLKEAKKKREEYIERRKLEGKPTSDWVSRDKRHKAFIDFDRNFEKSQKDFFKPDEFDRQFQKAFKEKKESIQKDWLATVAHIENESAAFKQRFKSNQAQMDKEIFEWNKQFFTEMRTEVRDFKKRSNEFNKKFHEVVSKYVDCGAVPKDPLMNAGVELLCSP